MVAMDRDKREEKRVEKKETDLFGLDCVVLLVGLKMQV